MSSSKKSCAINQRRQIKRNGWQILLPTVLLLSALQFSIDEARAQFGQSKKYENNNEYVPEHLKTPPDLPFLPPYSGSAPAQYDSILAFKRQTDGPGYTLTFHVKEESPQVLDFYRSAFKQNRWMLEKKSETAKMIGANRRGASVSVMVMNPITKGYKTQVYVVYKISGQVK